jgi:hypothetical protein
MGLPSHDRIRKKICSNNGGDDWCRWCIPIIGIGRTGFDSRITPHVFKIYTNVAQWQRVGLMIPRLLVRIRSFVYFIFFITKGEREILWRNRLARPAVNRKVGGSNPSRVENKKIPLFFESIAQLAVRRFPSPEVGGSNPPGLHFFVILFFYFSECANK